MDQGSRHMISPCVLKCLKLKGGLGGLPSRAVLNKGAKKTMSLLSFSRETYEIEKYTLKRSPFH